MHRADANAQVASLSGPSVAAVSVAPPTETQLPPEVAELLSFLLTSTADGILATDANGLVTFVNKAAAQLTGCSPQEMLGRPAPFVANTVSNRNHGRQITALRRKDGSLLPICCSIAPFHSVDRNGKPGGHLVVFRENLIRSAQTEHLDAEDGPPPRSQHDTLTGLPNRVLFEERLLRAVADAIRRRKIVAVCCLGLDRFAELNATLGYELGDAFLKAVGQRLAAGLRKCDVLARLGGDCFFVALCDLDRPADVEKICERLRKDLRTPFLLEGHSLTISVSIGISLFPEHGDTVDLLLRNAEIALRAAKKSQRGTMRPYSCALGRQTRRAREMVDELALALEHQHFRLAYQPIYNLHHQVFAFEALLRWKHPTWGVVSPREFIPVAETTGLIVPLGDWVISEICRQVLAWDASGLPQVKIFANVSGVQLERADFATKISQILAHNDLAPERLELEITESWIISDLKAAARKLQRLRNQGIGIAIDDFGTGYSTLNYLQELPLDTLKIDRSFVHRLGRFGHPPTVSAITGMAHQFGLKTVAEGVEAEDQIAELETMGCDLMQGFFLSRPLAPQAASALLRRQPCAPLLSHPHTRRHRSSVRVAHTSEACVGDILIPETP